MKVLLVIMFGTGGPARQPASPGFTPLLQLEAAKSKVPMNISVPPQ